MRNERSNLNAVLVDRRFGGLNKSLLSSDFLYNCREAVSLCVLLAAVHVSAFDAVDVSAMG